MRVNLLLAATACLQLVAGIALQIVVLLIVGAGAETDAFVAAQSVPLVATALVIAVVQSVWQPRIVFATEDGIHDRGLAGLALGHAMLIGTALVIPLMLSARWWIGWIFPGLVTSQLALTHEMTLVLMPSVILNGAAAVLTINLRAKGNYLEAELSSAISGVAAVALTLYVVPYHGIAGAAYVGFARALAHFTYTWWRSGRPFAVLRPLMGEREVWARTRSMIAGAALFKTGPLVDRYWASLAPSGGLTLFNLASAAVMSAGTVIERAFAMPIGLRQARLAHALSYRAMRLLHRSTVLTGLAAGAAGALTMAAIAEPASKLIHLVFGIGLESAAELWVIALLLTGALMASAMAALPVSGLQAIGDYSTPVRTGSFGFVVGLALKALGFGLWGLQGLAAGISAHYLLNLAINFFCLEISLDRLIKKSANLR